MSKYTIGWAGLGNMGTPMVKNLIKAGFKVIVYNRTAEKTISLQSLGASIADNPAELMKSCDVFISMVSDDTAINDLYLGKNGAITGDSLEGKIIIDMSTVSPETNRRIASITESKNGDHLDAPVSGSVKPAEEGQLIIMAGGKKEAYEKCLPVFECLGKVSFHLGGHGAGNSAKLAINLLLSFNVAGLAETIHFATENGIDAKDMLTIINESSLGNGLTKAKSVNILSNNYKPAFALKLLAKDLRLVKAQGLETPAGTAIYQLFEEASKKEFAEEDMIAIIKSFK